MSAKKPANGKARPDRAAIITPERKAEICTWIAGGKSLARWCREQKVDYSLVTDALRSDSAFAANYASAREDSADADADELAHIRERMLAGEITPEQARVAIDSLKWSAGKRKPKVYGDKAALELSGTVTTQHMTRAEWKKRQAEANA